ncbi:MAG: LuxR C-terminal-related transcriptional regulator [Polyangiaceae bacterium]
MSTHADVVAVIESAYRLDLGEDAWLGEVATMRAGNSSKISAELRAFSTATRRTPHASSLALEKRGCSSRTVANHLAGIFKKLGIASRAELTRGKYTP